MSTGLIFRTSIPLCLIELSGDVLHKMLDYRQAGRHAPEAGGVLLGVRRGPYLQILELTTPQPRDQRHRTGFLRVGKSHQRMARKLWRKSGNLYGYLGEWHTHPEPHPTPSFIDRMGWRMRFLEEQLPLVHIIVGTKEIRTWYCDARGSFHETTKEK